MYQSFSLNKISNKIEDIDEIKEATLNLSKDMKVMKKVIEEFQMSLSEKDAEIIKLKMHLGDEKNKF